MRTAFAALALALTGSLHAQILSPILESPSASAAGCTLSFTTNLSVWMRADSLTCTGGCTGTNTVTGFTDLSGNGNNGTTSSSILTYAAADINGRPAVHFPAGAVPPGPNSFTLTTPLTPSSVTIFAVVKDATGFTRGTIISGLTGSLEYFMNDGGSNFQQGANSTFTALLIGSTSTQSSAYHQINFTGVSGTSQSLRRDRAADGSASVATSFTGAAMSKIGYNAQAGATACSDAGNTCTELNGNLAELLIYSAALSGGNNTIVENYLNCEYGL